MGTFGIMTQIKSYGVPFTHGAGNILPTHTQELPLEKTVPKPVGNIFPSHTQVIPAFQQSVGNFFNPAHAITEPIREKIEVVPKFKIDSNLIIGLIAIVLALITLKKVKI